MDSKIVSREIQKRIWPVLKSHGFNKIVGRSAWRHSASKVDVVNFQSFNSYLAESVGCTTFSFAINLGCLLAFVPPSLGSMTLKDGIPLPREYECHLRCQLRKTIEQPELARSDVWFIGDNGGYLSDSISDALTQIESNGLRWFDRFADEEEVLRTLLHEDEGETWGIGAKDSPQRHILLGCAQVHRNRRRAIEHLNTALRKLSESPIDNPLVPQLTKHIAELTANSG
jgi:hypothetical protein